MHPIYRTALLLLLVTGSATAQFFNPGKKVTWTIGEQQTITYHTTLKSYTIALWQESPAGDAALLGPVVFQTSEGPESSFDWVVQTYSLELKLSGVFFFWLFEGDAADQGKQSAPHSISSSYFNITDGPQSKSASSTTTSSVSSTTSSVASSKSTHSILTTTSAVPSTSLPTSSVADDGDLSSGAKAGIGVGVSVAGVVAMSCLLLFWRYRAKQKKELGLMQAQYAQHAQYAQYAHHAGFRQEELQGVPNEYKMAQTSAPVEMG